MKKIKRIVCSTDEQQCRDSCDYKGHREDCPLAIVEYEDEAGNAVSEVGLREKAEEIFDEMSPIERFHRFQDMTHEEQIQSIINGISHQQPSQTNAAVSEGDATVAMLDDIISWEKDLSEYKSLEGILRERYKITKR